MKQKPKQEGEEHQTKEGYCCACEYDIAGFEEKIEQAHQKVLQEVKKLITEEMLVCQQEGTPTSRLTSLYNKIKERRKVK